MKKMNHSWIKIAIVGIKKSKKRLKNNEKIKIVAFLISLVLLTNLEKTYAKDIYVSQTGNDNNIGTKNSPFVSFERAVNELGKFTGKVPVTIWVGEGTYYLSQTIELSSKYSGSPENPVVFSALPGAKVIIKGSKILNQLKWQKYKDGIFVTQISEGLDLDQLFVNGERQIRARFPNYDYNNPLRGGEGYQQVTDGTNHRYDEWFSYDPEKFTNKVWKNPETGIVHGFQSHNWGNLQYHIKGVDRVNNKILLGEGGWQLQRSHGIGGKGKVASWFFIDNIFEELDTPGEWFLDTKSNQLYYYPKADVNLNGATIEIPVLKDLIQLKGSSENPVRNVSFKGFCFTQSEYTFMDKYEPVARGDWAIHRGGTIFMEGSENCTIEDCRFENLGGNGVFMSAYNRNNQVKNCLFVHTGESAVCFVGSPSAVRFYQTWDDWEIYGKNWNDMRKDMDLKPGPKSPDYPENCVVENCIMHDFGDVGKQIAGIYISMSHKIRISHNTIYNCPRAGICINDGTWGGHIIENCDIWETVRETGEHGPFNAWGRERQWLGGSGSANDFIKEYTKLDAIDATIVRNNRIANFRKSISAGNWTIDLDDGSSNFEIYNNLNLGSTIKLRDGMYRKVYNNITVGAIPLGWHVWPEESEDEIYRNIFVISGAVPGAEEATNQFVRPIGLSKDKKWSNYYDNNLYWNVNFPDSPNILQNKSFQDWQAEGYDLHSQVANPLFVDPKNGDYSIKESSPALKLGFKNFPMNEFGHQMARIVPFGGEFSGEVSVRLIADVRMKKDGSLHYTLDGSEPNIHSPKYVDPIKLNQSTMVKSCSFDALGNPVGFTNGVQFTKVKTVVYPNWFSSLLAGKYTGANTQTDQKALEKVVNGALMVNIADDPDLIDASGGYNSGCYIKSIDPGKGNMWKKARFVPGWIIQKIDGKDVRTTDDLEQYITDHKGKIIVITAVKNYQSKIFTMRLK
jgi:hypothetical protein